MKMKYFTLSQYGRECISMMWSSQAAALRYAESVWADRNLNTQPKPVDRIEVVNDLGNIKTFS